jgi:hypothetical protein
VILVLSACADPDGEPVSPEPSAGATEGASPGAENETAEVSGTSPDDTEVEYPGGPQARPEEPVSGDDATEEPDDEAPAEEEPGHDAPGLAVDDLARITTISEEFQALMRDTTWEPGCPVELDELRKLAVRYVDLDDSEQEGALIVHEDVADDLLGVFAQLYEDRFPIARIEPIELFDGDDDASMAANNTSAFNCRPITGSDSWSEHSYGWAVDINPIQNPYERDGEVLPPEGEPYLDRDEVRPGMVSRPGVVEHFDALGWGWGGDWNTLKDYMHFSLTGR